MAYRTHPRLGRTDLAIATAGLMAATLAFVQSAAAQIPSPGPLYRVARQDIFSSCTADHVGSQFGTVYPLTHIEPNLAINPANPKNMLVGLQQDRWSNGGSRGMRGAYSLDAGASWAPTSTPNVTQCQVGVWQRSSDPWVSFSPDGTAYFSQLTNEVLENPSVFGRSGQVVSQSTDGGVNWYPPTTLIDNPAQLDDTKPQILNDKNSVTADPTNSKLAYVVWDQLTGFTPGFGVTDDGHTPDPDASAAVRPASPALPAKDGMSITRRLRNAARVRQANAPLSAAAAAAFPTYVTGPTWFSRTFDHGQTWERAKIIYDPGSNLQTIGNQVVRLPDGRLADFFTQINDFSGATTLGFVTSSDNGKTWGKASFPQVVVNTPALTPNTQEDIRSADILFSVAVDPTNGLLYLTWEDTRFTGDNEISVAFSADSGYSWYGPVRVNQTPRNPLHPLFQQALIPSVITTDDGTAFVTYYDFRNDKVGAKTDLTDYWAVTCNPFTSEDTCQSNKSWHREVRLTLWSFDYNLAPDANGHFLGDYMGLKSVGQNVYPVFGVSEAPNKTTLYMRPLKLPATTAAHAALIARAN